METSQQEQDPLAQDRNAFLQVIEAVPDSEYVGINDFADLPGEVYFASVRWERNLFRSERASQAQPASAVTREYHLARGGDGIDYDLLRHRYVVEDVPVTIIECAGQLHVEVPSSSVPGNPQNGADRLGALASFLLIEVAAFRFHPLVHDSRQQTYSTNPEEYLVAMDEWSDRVDGVVSDRTTALIIYKVSLDRDDIFIDLAEWFPQSFRESHDR